MYAHVHTCDWPDDTCNEIFKKMHCWWYEIRSYLLEPIFPCVQLEEKQQSLSSFEAKLKQSEGTLVDSNREKDATIKSLQDQVHVLTITR